MKVIRPVLITGSSLVTSNIPEADYPDWQAGTTYAIGERVISTATHRVYESAIGGNVGKDPAAGSVSWTDVSATNRWAMFDPEVGAATTTNSVLSVKIAPPVPIDAIGFVDLIASYVRVQVMNGGTQIYDRTQQPIDGEAASTTLTFLGLPAVAGAQIIVTALNDTGTPGGAFFGSTGQRWGDTAPRFGPIASGATSIGTIVLGTVLALGTTEEKPTVGITDYSLRQTDDFGITTVVERAFAKKITAKSRLSVAEVDTVQRRLADLRAQSALWIGEEGFEALTVYGFYKDFSVELKLGDTNYCSLTIEGLPTIDVDTLAFDPAPDRNSDLQVIEPIVVGQDILTTSNVAESDAPAWASGTTYALGATVMSQRRVFESLVAGNVGNDPTIAAGKWLDVGPANRWAMFDQALGSATTRAGQIIVTLTPPQAVTGLAVLDASATSVRVQAPGYDESRAIVSEGGANSAATFLNLTVAPGATITVTIAGSTPDVTVSVGTLIIGTLRALGRVETSPSFGIRDYSQKTADAFGNTKVVERAWAKRMTLRSLVSTDATGALLRRFALLRAKPSLWIGRSGFDSLTVYGFFKDLSVEIGQATSLCSLTIEGLSEAFQPKPIATPSGDVEWPDVKDPDDTKPADNATNGADPNSPFGPGGTVGDANALIAAAKARQDTLETVTIPAINAAGAQASQRITEARAAADFALSTIESEVDRVDQRIDNISISGGYDDTAIYAEIERIDTVAEGLDAAVAQSVQTINARITTTDTDVRAFVETKETAAVGRETAISQRLDQLIATGGGGSEGVDAVARAEISRVEQASVLGQQGLATRTTTLEASSRADPSMLNGNANFSNWPTERGEVPSGWGLAANSPGSSGARTTGVLGRYALRTTWAGSGSASNFFYAVSGLNFGDFGGGVDPGMVTGPGWYVMEADITLVSGSLVGSGLYCAIYNTAGNNQATATASFSGSSANGGPPPGAGVTGRRYKFAVLVDLTNPQTASLRFHPMVVWEEFAIPSPAKELLWHKAGMRAATPEEVATKRVDTGLTLAVARIQSTEDTLADLPNRYATAQRATNLEASVGNVGGRVAGLEIVTSNGTFATAARAEQIASYAGGVNATVEQQAGTIAGLGVRTAAYVRFITTAGNNRAQLTLSADANGGGGADLIGDLSVSGNLLVGGSIITDKVAPNAITSTVAIAGLSGAGVSAATDGETARLTITSTGGTVVTQVQSDGNRTAGAGLMQVQLFAAYAGSEVALSRPVAFSPSNTAVPVSFFSVNSFPAGQVQFFLRYFAANSTWSYSSGAIAAIEYKR